MKANDCPKERTVARALHTGRWEEGLKGHLEGCSCCREVVRVSEWMKLLARNTDRERPLPEPGAIWRRALIHKFLARQPAVGWMGLAQSLTNAIPVAALAAWIAWNWRQLNKVFQLAGQMSVERGWEPPWGLVGSTSCFPATVLLCVSLCLCMLALLAVRPQISGE